MRSNHNTRNDGCHKDISQGQNVRITHTKISTAQENFILGSPFVSFSLKNILHQQNMLLAQSCFWYCYQEIRISQLNISSKQGNSKTKLSINSRAETNSGGMREGQRRHISINYRNPPPQGLILVNQDVLVPLSTNKLLHSTHSNSLRAIGDI